MQEGREQNPGPLILNPVFFNQPILSKYSFNLQRLLGEKLNYIVLK